MYVRRWEGDLALEGNNAYDKEGWLHKHGKTHSREP